MSLDADALDYCPDELPQPADGSLPTLLRNHVADARVYHRCAGLHKSLIDGLKSQRGVIVNGGDAVPNP